MSTAREAVEQLGGERAQLQVDEAQGKRGVFVIRAKDGGCVAIVPAVDLSAEAIEKARAVALRLAASPELERLAKQIAHGPADGESYGEFGVRVMETARPIVKGAVFPS